MRSFDVAPPPEMAPTPSNRAPSPFAAVSSIVSVIGTAGGPGGDGGGEGDGDRGGSGTATLERPVQPSPLPRGPTDDPVQH